MYLHRLTEVVQVFSVYCLPEEKSPTAVTDKIENVETEATFFLRWESFSKGVNGVCFRFRKWVILPGKSPLLVPWSNQLTRSLSRWVTADVFYFVLYYNEWLDWYWPCFQNALPCLTVANELFNGCSLQFDIKIRYKITLQNFRYNLNIK